MGISPRRDNIRAVIEHAVRGGVSPTRFSRIGHGAGDQFPHALSGSWVQIGNFHLPQVLEQKPQALDVTNAGLVPRSERQWAFPSLGLRRHFVSKISLDVPLSL